MSKISPKRRRLIIAACALVLIVLAVAGIKALFRPKVVPQDAPVVMVEEARRADVNIFGDYVGRIRAQLFAELRARVEGYLEGIYFEDGAEIKRGQKLFAVDRTVYQAKVERARAQVAKAQAVAMKTKRDLERIRPLYEQNAASQLDLDNAVAAYESAVAEEKIAQADLTQAELTLSYTYITSPISGRISERFADIGTLVGPGGQSLLANVVKSDTVFVEFTMTTLEYVKLKNRDINLGQHDDSREWNPYVTVTLADGSNFPYRGLVDFASPSVDPTTGTFTVRAVMPNPGLILMPGEFTKVRVLLDVRANAIEVPARAVEIEKGGAYVYVVRPDSVVERRFVEIGPEIGRDIIIERGLAAGENVVVEGYHKLRHGMKVRPEEVADEPEESKPEA
ncbi:MAG: efflux RND transporter periplasmic adaptor subunit [Muribaculaceae bacterium]|nr:efflux RND transporter periplasmic adaptor subunit [Muribaculaceae bacterium]